MTSPIGSLARKQNDSTRKNRARLCGNCASAQLFRTISTTLLLYARKCLRRGVARGLFPLSSPYPFSSFTEITRESRYITVMEREGKNQSTPVISRIFVEKILRDAMQKGTKRNSEYYILIDGGIRETS